MLRQPLVFLTACVCVLWPEAAFGAVVVVWAVRLCME